MILSVANSRPRNMQSVQVKELLPEYTANDTTVDSLSRFLEDYYEYMNSEGMPSREIASISQNKDIDAATEKYLDEIELLIAKYTPRSNLIDRERLLKIINHYYTIRGTEEGTKLFFKLFYGEDISINYPRERMLNTSDGSGKYVNFSLKTITLDDGTTLDIKKYLDIVDNEDRRVYGQYEYNDDLKLYENIGKIVETQYSHPQLGQSILGSELNTYVGHNVAISSDATTIAVNDRKGAVKTYRYDTSNSTWVQFGNTLTGQSALNITVTLTDSTDRISLNSHGLNNGDEVSFVNLSPNIQDIDEGRIYYVANTTANTFKLTTTPGANAITFRISVGSTISATLAKYKRFGHAMALNHSGTKLLISEPGFSNYSQSGRVILYEYNVKTHGWNVAKLGNSASNSIKNAIFYGLVSLGDDVAVFGHAVALNAIGDSISISSTGHTSGTYQDYVLTQKYKLDDPIYKEVTLAGGTDTVTLNSHSFKAGDFVSFSSVTDTTGIKIDKKYYVINTTPNTFKITEKLDSGQIEIATAAGTITSDGNAIVFITSSSFTPNTVDILVDVETGDTAEQWAQKVRDALSSDIIIGPRFEIRGELDKIILVRKPISAGVYAPNDKTLNISLNNNTCTGITAAPISGNFSEGVPLDFSGDGTGTIRTYYTSWQSHGVFPINESELRNVSFNSEFDRVSLQNHGLSNGSIVVFNIVRDIDVIVAKRQYYVVNSTTHNFQLAYTLGGNAILFTEDGTGTILPQNIGIGKNLNILNGENFGWSLAYDNTGSRLAIGIPGASNKKIGKCGKINVYDYDDLTQTWSLAANTSLYGTVSPGERYGTSVSVSLDGSIVAGGAPYRAGTRTASQINVGCVLTHIWKGQYWKNYGKVPLYGKYVECLYGFQVSLNYNGSRLAVSAPGREISFGQANINTYSYVHLYEFDVQSDMWVERWPIIENKTYDQYLGYSLALDSLGQKLVCSTPYNYDPAKARRDGISYTQSAAENGKPTYINGSQKIAYTGTRWAWTSNGVTQNANIGNEASPWLAIWPAIPVITFSLVGSVEVYSLNKTNDSFTSDRTTRISKFVEEINGIKQENWAIYDIFSEATIDNYRHSYVTEPSGGSNFNYAYSTLEFIDIPDSGNYLASTTEPAVTFYYKADPKILTGKYTILTNNTIEIFCPNHGYKKGSLVNINFTSGDLVDAIFTVVNVYKSKNENDSFLVENTTYNQANVSLTASSNIVNFTSHNLPSGTPISFSTINSTTGLSTNTVYYILTENASSFKLSQYPFGQPIDFTNNGRGTIRFNRTLGYGDLSIYATAPIHPYEVDTWTPITTSTFNYSEKIKVNAVPDDIKWVKNDNKGFLSDYYKIQDSEYYQIHSYEIKTNLEPQHWRDEYEGFCHPSGYEMFPLLEIIDFSKNNWIDEIKYQYLRDYIPPRIRDLFSNKEKKIKLPTDLFEMLSKFGGQHTPRFQPGRGMDRDILINIFVKMLDDLGKTYTQKDDKDATMFVRNMVRRLNAYLSFYFYTSYERGKNWNDIKFLGDDLDGMDDVLYNNVGKTTVYKYNTATKKWAPRGNTLLGQRGDRVLNDVLQRGDEFGYSVSINNAGTRIAVAAPWNDNDADGNVVNDNDTDNDYRNDETNLPGIITNIGAVYIYDYTAETETEPDKWTLVGNPIIGESAQDLSGWDIMLNSTGSRVVIGAPYSGSNNSGHVRVYEYSAGSWVKLGSDIDGVALNDYTGTTVAINSSGSRIAVSTPYSASEKGSVKVYDYISNAWTQVGQGLVGSEAGDHFGWSVSLNGVGNRILIGAPNFEADSVASGNAYVYEYSAGSWVKLGSDIDSALPLSVGMDGNMKRIDSLNDIKNFGWSVSLNSIGDRIAVGAPSSDFLRNQSKLTKEVARGYVKIYELQGGTTWSLLGQTIKGELSNDNSGWSVSLDLLGNRVIVGSPSVLGEYITTSVANPNFNPEYPDNSIADSEADEQIFIPRGGGGHTKVYEFSTATKRWSQLGNDICGGAFTYKNGWSVDINSTGDTIVVGESGSNSRTEIKDGQSLGDGLLDLTPSIYANLSTAANSSKILNVPTHITRYTTTKRIILS